MHSCCQTDFFEARPRKLRVKNPRMAEAVSRGQFDFRGYGSINEETLHMIKEGNSSCNLDEEEKVSVSTLYPFKWDFIKLAMQNVPKWSDTLKKFCSIFCKIVKVWLTILEHYALKDWSYFNPGNLKPVSLFALLI